MSVGVLSDTSLSARDVAMDVEQQLTSRVLGKTSAVFAEMAATAESVDSAVTGARCLFVRGDRFLYALLRSCPASSSI